MSQSSPGLTTVLAVGLERYDYGEPMDLPGAAEHAVRFARWAHGCGVPAARIRLGCSWLEELAASPIPGAQLIGTTRDALDRALHEVMAEGGDLLLLYWCGHGLADEGGQSRVLFTSNATQASKLNLPVDEIRRLLASTHGTGFARQILVIDACANYVEEMGFDTGLPPGGFGKLAPRQVPQFVYFATDLGQIAAYNRAERKAAFSTAALGWLEKLGRPFPPDVEAMRAHVDGIFTRRAESGEYGQRPVALVVKAFTGGEERISYRVAPAHGALQPSQLRRLTRAVLNSPVLAGAAERAALAAALDAPAAPGLTRPAPPLQVRVTEAFATGRAGALLDALEALVDDDDSARLAVRAIWDCWARQQWTESPMRTFGRRVTLQQVRAAYQRAVPSGGAGVVHTLDDAVEAAADFGRRGDRKAPLYQLVAMLEHLTGAPVADAWFELDDDQLAGLRNAAPGWLEDVATRLVVDLRSGGCPRGVPPWPTLVVGHICRRLPSGPRWDREDLECEPTLDGVQGAVQQLVACIKAQDEVRLTIGFIMPRVLHGSLPEGWLLEQEFADASPVGIEHPAVLHSGERLARPSLHRVWEKRAVAVQERLANSAPGITWVDAAHRHNPPVIRKVVTDATTAMIGLGFAPGQATADLKGDPILATVAMGAPYVLWLEEEPDDWDAVRQRIADLIDRGRFEDLAQRLHEFRQQHPQTLGTGLRLLWDDPDLLPPVIRAGGAAMLAGPTGGAGDG